MENWVMMNGKKLKYRLIPCQDVFYGEGYSMMLDETKEKKKTNKR